MINSVVSSTYDGNLQNQGEFEGENATVLNESSFRSWNTRNSDCFFLTTSNDGPFNNFGNMDESMPSQLWSKFETKNNENSGENRCRM